MEAIEKPDTASASATNGAVPERLINGDDGRTYRFLPSGLLEEVIDDKQSAKRLLDSITDDYSLDGIRFSNVKDAEAPGIVVGIAIDEAQSIINAIKNVLKARTKG